MQVTTWLQPIRRIHNRSPPRTKKLP